MKIIIRACPFGQQSINAKLDDGTILGIKIEITPYRRVKYFKNSKPVSPLGVKSPTAKYLPQYKEMLTYANV